VSPALGRPRAHTRLVDSTNERARALAAAGAPHGTLVTADEQSAGRGRHGRSWRAEPGSALLLSLVLRDLDTSDAILPLAAAVAVCEAAEEVAPVECRIKWPNDVWIERRKLAGILIEGRPQQGWTVLGIGLNVTTTRFPGELSETATSLRLAAPGSEGEVDEVLGVLLEALTRWLNHPTAGVLAAWRSRDALRGEPIRWSGGRGTAVGVDDAGALLVETPEGRLALQAGEVHLEGVGCGP